jgi:hypothetical protein
MRVRVDSVRWEYKSKLSVHRWTPRTPSYLLGESLGHWNGRSFSMSCDGSKASGQMHRCELVC